MKRAVVYVLVGMVLGAGAVAAAQSDLMPFREKYKNSKFQPIPHVPSKGPDPFVGKWEIDKERSSSYPRIENIEIKVAGDVQDYKNDIANVPGPTRHQGYETRWNEMLWVPYMRDNVGEPFLWVMTVQGDARTHYRFVRNLDGTFGGIMLRRMAPDGQSYVSIGINPDGKTQYTRYYKKVDRFSHTVSTEELPCKDSCK
jgi:hypothetical protein